MPTDVASEVRRRYDGASKSPEAQLCCPVTPAEASLLAAIPEEVLEIDYGCGDPSRWALPGESVLDLGSGSGKSCFLLSQRVGPEGRVLGVDAGDGMLELARKHQAEVARRVGYANVRFAKALIQDLALDLEAFDRRLSERPVRTVEDWNDLEAVAEGMRRLEPLVPDASIDLVVSNCVLNLVQPRDKERLFAEIFRVLKRGGRAVIADIVCDEDPTAETMADPEMWSGCISGSFREDSYLKAFERAGFHGVEILERAEEPWRVIDGVEYRSMTVRAFKGKQGPCLERNQAVLYRGPWRSVEDDDNHRFPRGERVAVCDKTFGLMTDPKGPYAGSIVPLPPVVEVPLESAEPFACRGTMIRSPRETKGADYRETTEGEGPSCAAPDCC
jgi:ubiquinone/menaquinone biosynthesis C-methylase UbiE